jgi:imidazolonepropionase-like amidohydrolase
MRQSMLCGLMLACVGTMAAAQQSTLPLEGLRNPPPTRFVLSNARIVTAPGESIERGIIVIRDGRIERVERGASIDPTAIDLNGATVYAGFIDLATSVSLGLPAPGAPAAPGPTPAQQQLDEPGARHFSRRVRPELSAAERLKLDEAAHQKLRALGFTTALTAPASGIFRGQGALIQLIDGKQAKDALLKANATQQLAFETSFWPSDEYPGSLMGAIALIRQTLIDARWQRDMRAYAARQKNAPRFEANLALDALEPLVSGRQLALFRADDELDFERIGRVAKEFELKLALLGNGFEYRRLSALAANGHSLVVPIDFPAAPDVSDPDVALNADLSVLQHWEQAPANLARLDAAGVRFALTSLGGADADKAFWSNLRRAVRAGLKPETALAALTTVPAQLLELDTLGRIAPGQLANIVIADRDLFRDDRAKLREVWVHGNRYVLDALDQARLDGEWTLTGLGESRRLKIDGTSATVGEEKLAFRRDGNALELEFPGSWVGADGRLSAALDVVDQRLNGVYARPDGTLERFSGELSKATPETAAKPADDKPIPEFRGYPAGAWSVTERPTQDTVLIRNATLWTLAGDSPKRSGDILLRDGKIAAIGEGLSAPGNARVIEANGRHVTPGIVDAHSHTAIARNVNEPSSAVTAEVRIGDVLDPTDLSVYRQLAGGVTSAQLLHGSANPIGGQSATIKFRWGEGADAYPFVGAFPTIKFALGENVKQSNRGDLFVQRYPQTRMGVEQLLRDTFLAAREYAEAKKSGNDGVPFRRSLRLEAVAEIINHERFVNIHSYRQDEILMFARLAKEFGLTHVTFQHILEGYKVAEALREIDAGASGFADWWAFKMEVYDAIPYNGAILTNNGVLASFNSDSDEMARRLNTEAAKAIKYGGLSEIEALKLITINPAKHLGIDDRVGSLEVGKDADVVLWNGDPLSSFTRVDTTFVDGRVRFDREADLRARAQVDTERNRLIARVLESGVAKPSDQADSKPKRSVSIWQFQTHRGWIADFASRRTIYHSGEDINACSAQEHHL